MSARTCRVSFTDAECIRHTTEVQAESLHEAAILAVRVFRQDGWIDVVGTAARLEIQVLPPVVTHSVSLLQVRRWLDGAVTDPADAVRKRRLKELLAS
jgi:hypothetical protein